VVPAFYGVAGEIERAGKMLWAAVRFDNLADRAHCRSSLGHRFHPFWPGLGDRGRFRIAYGPRLVSTHLLTYAAELCALAYRP